MSNSSLITYTRISPNSNNPRNNKILKITPHHMAGNLSLVQFGNLVAQPSRQMSSNYAIDSKGNIGLFCEEKNRSWCSSSPSNDHQAITIEVANDGGAPDWHVSDAALESLIKLCVDVCQRNGIEKLVFTGNASGNLTQHNYFSSTACPGPYLKSKFPYIESEVNRRLNTSTGGIVYMKALDVFAKGKKNIQGFNTANVNDVGINNIPDGRYQVYKYGVNIGSGLQGALIRHTNGNKYYVAQLNGYTEMTDISVSDAESRWGWYAAGTGDCDCSEIEAELEATESALAKEKKTSAAKDKSIQELQSTVTMQKVTIDSQTATIASQKTDIVNKVAQISEFGNAAKVIAKYGK